MLILQMWSHLQLHTLLILWFTFFGFCLAEWKNNAIEKKGKTGFKKENFTENMADKESESFDFRYSPSQLDMWTNLFRECSGAHQSPINLDSIQTTPDHFPQIFWWNYHRKPDRMRLTNNGHTVRLVGFWDDKDAVPFHWQSMGTGNKMGVKYYKLDHIHFHWGENSNSGSEHLINKISYPLEMHAVHYDRQYSTLQEALTRHEGIRVIGILFALSKTANPALDEIVKYFPRIKDPTSIDIKPFDMGKLLPRFRHSYYTYDGSLTTPPCIEAVSWVVQLTVSSVSEEQLKLFRLLMDHHHKPLAGNHRPIQSINNRRVLRVH